MNRNKKSGHTFKTYNSVNVDKIPLSSAYNTYRYTDI